MSKETEEQIRLDLSWVQDRIYNNNRESEKLSRMAEEMYRDYQSNKNIGQQPDPMLAVINTQLHILTENIELILNYLKLIGMKSGIPYKESETKIEIGK